MFNKYIRLKAFLIKIIVIFFTIVFTPTLWADGILNNTILEEKNDKSHYKYQAFYIILLGNIPIGTAMASTDDKNTNIPNKTTLKIVTRMGRSPIFTLFSVQTTPNFINTSEYHVKEELFSFVDKENQDLVKSNIIQKLENTSTTNLKNLFFEPKNSIYNLKDSLSPFPKIFFNFQDEYEAKYDGNKFLKNALLRLNSDITLEIKRTSKTNYFNFHDKFVQNRLDVGLIASFEDQMDEVDRLLKSLSLCQAEMTYLNKSILKKLPYESYLMHRRIINLNKFCQNLESAINKSESDEINRVALLTQEHILHFMEEDPLELPHSILEFPERTLYYNQNMTFLWPRITTILIQNSIKEMQNFFNLDFNRKSLLDIKLIIKSLEPRSVVRADIHQIKSNVNFKVITASQKPYIVDGITFANNSDYNLENICKKNSGNVGIDLTNPTQVIVNSVGIRGVWDIPTKLTAAQVFAMQAVSDSNCKTIYFITPPELHAFLNHVLTSLKKEALSQENSLLLSNYRSKKLWVMPGQYRITISSVKNEKVISVQEFTIDPKTQTNVIANVK